MDEYERSRWREHWICYCGDVHRWTWDFPHWDCSGGRILNEIELLFWLYGTQAERS